MQLEIQKNGNQVTMPLDTLEHIANCLANQKYVGQWNADATENVEESKQVDKYNQAAIDNCWIQLMNVVSA